MALPNDILRTIADVMRRLANLESNPQPPNITLSAELEGTFDLAAAGSPGDVIQISASLNKYPYRLLGIPAFTIYKNAITAANHWPFGSNWSAAERRDFSVSTWFDWGESDNNGIVVKMLVVNKTASPITGLIVIGNFRYLQKGAGVA